ncbi:MAG: SDR family NAD(P)-dependent oxidoreductase [Alphaproteobacteria bacterium]|nr:SDR family NAD(P)-dependent oxidoreductase [Alphaproteobacteria bacterium]
MAERETALIVGAGRGLSAALARRFAAEGVQVALAARNTGKLDALCTETGAKAYECDVADAASVEALFARVESEIALPDIAVFNASARVRGPILEIDPAEVARAVHITALGGFHVAQSAAKRMVPRGAGAIFFTGASASVKGYANSTTFAMGKFALRGLAQALARELQPKNIHVAHFVIDGGILQGPDDPRAGDRGPDGMLHPDAIAQTYRDFWRQHRSAWSWEIELRPWVEKF